jgi:hypothetical protein
MIQVVRNPHSLEQTTDEVIDHIFKTARMSVKRWDRWEDDRTSLSSLYHQAQVTYMKRRFAHDQNQWTSFLQHDVSRARQQVSRIGISNRG